MENKRLGFFLFFAPALTLDWLAMSQLWRLESIHDYGAARVLFWHGLAIACYLPAFLLLLPGEYARHKLLSSLLILGFSLPLPLAGPAVLLAFARALLSLRKVDRPEKNYVFGDQKYLTSSDRYELSVKEGTRSVLEIINSPDKAARRKAIVAMRLVEPKKAIPILRRALQDSDEEVRIYAQGVLSKIVENLEASLKQAELGEPSEVEDLLRLAEQYHEFVYLGLVDEESQDDYLARAIDCLERARQSEPHNQQVLLLLVKCCLKKREIAAAKAALESLKACNPEAEFTIPWEMEVLFYERDWRGLETLLQELNSRRWANSKLKPLLSFWLRPQPPALKP